MNERINLTFTVKANLRRSPQEIKKGMDNEINKYTCDWVTKQEMDNEINK